MVFGDSGRRRLRRRAGEILDAVFPGRPQSFWYLHRPVDDCRSGRGGRAQNEGVVRFMAKWFAADKVEAGLRYAVVVVECPNVTRRTKARIAQSKRVRADTFPIVRQLVSHSC